jgi:hypothetical protein
MNNYSNYSLNITPPVLWITSQNSWLKKCVKKVIYNIVSNPMIQKFNMFVLQSTLSMATIL